VPHSDSTLKALDPVRDWIAKSTGSSRLWHDEEREYHPSAVGSHLVSVRRIEVLYLRDDVAGVERSPERIDSLSVFVSADARPRTRSDPRLATSVTVGSSPRGSVLPGNRRIEVSRRPSPNEVDEEKGGCDGEYG
jgi:hypothetical protein